MWADNADQCAKQYAGTGALKTDFTRSDNNGIHDPVMKDFVRKPQCLLYRTGKRTHMGMLMDGYNSAIRYYYNNFADGFRQVGG